MPFQARSFCFSNRLLYSTPVIHPVTLFWVHFALLRAKNWAPKSPCPSRYRSETFFLLIKFFPGTAVFQALRRGQKRARFEQHVTRCLGILMSLTRRRDHIRDSASMEICCNLYFFRTKLKLPDSSLLRGDLDVACLAVVPSPRCVPAFCVL